MARLARLAIGGLPHHVIQRGHNGQAVFVDGSDRAFFLDCLRDAALRHAVAIHAYVLMENHYHLLLTPETGPTISRMMQDLGRRYVRFFNDRHGRRGTLWEGRYRSNVLEPETFLLACMVALDTNPVRSGGAERAALYPWSSHAHYAGIRVDPVVTPPAQYWGLGNTPFAREAAYSALVQEGLSQEQLATIADGALRGWALGSAEFVGKTQKSTARRISKREPGRPPLASQKVPS